MRSSTDKSIGITCCEARSADPHVPRRVLVAYTAPSRHSPHGGPVTYTAPYRHSPRGDRGEAAQQRRIHQASRASAHTRLAGYSWRHSLRQVQCLLPAFIYTPFPLAYLPTLLSKFSNSKVEFVKLLPHGPVSARVFDRTGLALRTVLRTNYCSTPRGSCESTLSSRVHVSILL